MVIKITRKRSTPNFTEGTVTVNGEYLCDSLEFTKSMMAEGLYDLNRRSRPFCHGNAWREMPRDGLQNRIMVGERIIPGVVLRSRPHYDHIVERMRKSQTPIVLIITSAEGNIHCL